MFWFICHAFTRRWGKSKSGCLSAGEFRHHAFLSEMALCKKSTPLGHDSTQKVRATWPFPRLSVFSHASWATAIQGFHTFRSPGDASAVSYTHLTLPTIY